jgi:hypothetical protein
MTSTPLNKENETLADVTAPKDLDEIDGVLVSIG